MRQFRLPNKYISSLSQVYTISKAWLYLAPKTRVYAIYSLTYRRQMSIGEG